MLANRLDNSNIKVDLELLDNPLMLELLVNLQTKETQWEIRETLWEIKEKH